jgi:hypothetical protein
VVQPVQNTTICVKHWNERIEKSTITDFVFSPGRPRDQISHLDKARRFRIHKERDLYEIPEMPPSRAIDSEPSSEHLQRLFMMAFVHDNEPALIVILTVIYACEK